MRINKNYLPDETKTYRDKLSAAINTSSLIRAESFGEYISTENSSRIIQLPDRIIVMFDWPMRCTPWLYFSPNNLLTHGNARIVQWNRRGFQIIFDKPFSLPKFAFFADASPTEYKTKAESEREKWKKSVGYDEASSFAQD